MSRVEQFKSELYKAIEAYETKTFSVILWGMSEHRSHDIKKLKACIKQETDPVYLKEKINQILDEMLTGLHFRGVVYIAGNSSLKTRMKAVLGSDRFSDSSFLRDEVYALREEKSLKIKKVEDMIEAMGGAKNIEELLNKTTTIVEGIQKKYKKLEEAYDSVWEENQVLKRENERLKSSLRTVVSENETLQSEKLKESGSDGWRTGLFSKARLGKSI